MDAPLTIACLLYPHVMSLDLTGPLQVFASANDERQRQGLPAAYRLPVLGQQAVAMPTSAGFQLVAEQAWSASDPAHIDTLLIPGGQGDKVQCHNLELLAWLRSVAPQIRRVGSVCSGALILAAAGLLDGRRATTHWADLDCLRLEYPRVEISADCLHTYDAQDPGGNGHIFTSAGVTAGIDLALALALVEADLGRPLALAVAKRLVLFLRRPSGQAQFSALLTPEPSRLPSLANLLEWVPLHLHEDLSLAVLAAQANMTPRTLSRTFNQELGMGPGRYVEIVHLEAARNLLQNAKASISTVARLSGFNHPENLRRSFHKHLGVSPQECAERFA